MKVLFISRSKQGSPSIITFNQGESLKKEGIEVDYFLIEGKGIFGYLKSIVALNKHIKSSNFDLFHAHYSLSGFLAALSNCKPLIVSLMGSDVKARKGYRFIIKAFNFLFWNTCIVKTSDMRKSLKMNKIHVIPNGVNLDAFSLMNKLYCRKELNLNINKKIILFLADPSRAEKNFKLAKSAVELLNNKDVVLIPKYNIPISDVPKYLNAADLLLLTSKWEGSVNVVKEALACNLPIVSTDVGDVRKNISGVHGCFITSQDPVNIKENIIKSLEFNKKTNGRENLISLGLDSKTIAKKIIKIYKSAIN